MLRFICLFDCPHGKGAVFYQRSRAAIAFIAWADAHLRRSARAGLRRSCDLGNGIAIGLEA